MRRPRPFFFMLAALAVALLRTGGSNGASSKSRELFEKTGYKRLRRRGSRELRRPVAEAGSATVDPAWIGFVGGVVGTVASAVIAVRQVRGSERLARLNGELREELARLEGRLQADLARLNSELEAERHERVALLDRDLRAEDVLARYREPLAAGAFDLQSRCYNILRLGFFGKFGTGHERFRGAQTTTLFRFAQYFGWTEILRRDIQFLSFPEADDTRRVAQLQGSIARRLASSTGDEPLMIWADEQRAIGERMIVQEHDNGP